MADVRAIAGAYGVRIEMVDLGDWGRVRLIAEYDPDGPVIRVNSRESRTTLRQARRPMVACVERGPALDRAIAHELYHHREAIGEVPRLADRGEREAAADAYADALLSAGGDAAPVAGNLTAAEAR